MIGEDVNDERTHRLLNALSGCRSARIEHGCGIAPSATYTVSVSVNAGIMIIFQWSSVRRALTIGKHKCHVSLWSDSTSAHSWLTESKGDRYGLDVTELLHPVTEAPFFSKTALLDSPKW